MTQSARPSAAPMHGTAFLAAAVVAVLGILFALSDAKLSARVGTGVSATIGIEHQKAARLNLTVSAGVGPGLAELSCACDETVFLSLPATWTLREVRGAALEQVPADEAAFGFRRWTLPPNVTLSLHVAALPDSYEIHNPTNVPLQLTLRRINVADGHVDENVHLIQRSPMTIR